jgi:hypothetical protein
MSNQNQKPMKRVMFLAGLILALSLTTMTVSAQKAATDDQKKVQTQQTTTTKCQFVDNNKDGKCDKCLKTEDNCKEACAKEKSGCSSQMKCSGATKGSSCGQGSGCGTKSSSPQPEKK